MNRPDLQNHPQGIIALNPAKKTIVLFELWGLGDMTIALGAAREFDRLGMNVVLVGPANWHSWATSHSFVHLYIDFTAPWTSKRDKYTFSRYKLKAFRTLRAKILETRPFALCELRGDVRNLIFLHLLAIAPVETLVGKHFRSRYSRVDAIVQRFSSARNPSVPDIERPRSNGSPIVCSFSAAWKNRALPPEKALVLLRKISAELGPVTLICPPEGNEFDSCQTALRLESGIHFFRGNLGEIIQLIRTARACVMVDSGFLHVSAFFGLPTVGLFGFDDVEEWCPSQVIPVLSSILGSRRSKFDLSQENIQPLATIEADEVVAALKKLLSNEGGPDFEESNGFSSSGPADSTLT